MLFCAKQNPFDRNMANSLTERLRRHTTLQTGFVTHPNAGASAHHWTGWQLSIRWGKTARFKWGAGPGSPAAGGVGWANVVPAEEVRGAVQGVSLGPPSQDCPERTMMGLWAR